MDWFLERARSLGVEHAPPAPLLLGRHLLQLGVPAGPARRPDSAAGLRAATGRRRQHHECGDRGGPDAHRGGSAVGSAPPISSARAGRAMLPPLSTATVAPPPASGSAASAAAQAAAPLGSTTTFAWRHSHTRALHDGVVLHGDDLVDERLHDGEREVAGPHRQQAVSDAGGRRQRDRPAGRERRRHASRPDRLHADDARCGPCAALPRRRRPPAVRRRRSARRPAPRPARPP